MLALRAARMWDGVGERADGPCTVVVDGARIIDVTQGGQAPEGARLIDLGDVTLLPGLVDAHVHLVFDASPEPWTRLEGAGAEEITAIAHESALRGLVSGVTTVRDLGDVGFATLALREQYASGELFGPTLICSGPPLTAPSGHCHFLGGELDLTDPAPAVRAWAGRGVDLIKLMVSGGEITPGSTPFRPQLDRAVVAAVVRAAHAEGLPVTAHAHDPVSVAMALDAGADGLEHCAFLTEEGVADDTALRSRIAQSGVVVCPTPGTAPGHVPPPRIAERMAAAGAHFQALRAAGTRFVAGSDAGISPAKPHGLLPRTLLAFAQIGFSPAEVLRIGTSGGAELLGLAGRKGVIAAGADADLLAVPGDPLDDLGTLLEPVAVVARGRFALGGPSA